jgi:hypothetical protein
VIIPIHFFPAGKPHEVHQPLSAPQTTDHVLKFRIAVSHDDRLTMLEYCVNVICHQSRHMGNVVKNEIPATNSRLLCRMRKSRALSRQFAVTVGIAKRDFSRFLHSSAANPLRLFGTFPL